MGCLFQAQGIAMTSSPSPSSYDAIACQMDLRSMASPWAPGLVLAFGRWTGAGQPLSMLATGTGRSVPEAGLRCLGEMAENLSISDSAHAAPVAAHDAQGQSLVADARALPDQPALNLGSEGCAAHPDPNQARLAAACERIERAALALWWHGKMEALALPIPEDQLRPYRQAITHRRTRGWLLPVLPGMTSVLMLSDSGDGSLIALGSAAHPDPLTALDSALRDTLQAEIAWLAPPDHPDVAYRNRVDHALRPRLPQLAMAPEAAMPAAKAEPATDSLHRIHAALGQAGLRFGYADLTHPALNIPVYRCVCPDWPRARPLWEAGQ